jgi:hypothetical protein
MAGKYITLDEALVEQIQQISQIIPHDSELCSNNDTIYLPHYYNGYIGLTNIQRPTLFLPCLLFVCIEYNNYLALSVNYLEGISIIDEVKEFAASLGVKTDTFKAYCHTAGAILW